MIWAVVLNTVMAFAFLVALLFCIGDVSAAVTTPTGFPIIQIYYQATRSKAGATILVCMILCSLLIALFGVVASVSRLVWAFACDKGFPFSSFFARVRLVSRHSGTIRAWYHSMADGITDPPYPPHSSECSQPSDHHRRLAQSHQYRQHRRVHRDPLPCHHGSVCIVCDPNHFHHLAQTRRTTPILRSIPLGALGTLDQLLRLGFRHFHRHLSSFPTHAACGGVEYELCRANSGRHSLTCPDGLASQWS